MSSGGPFFLKKRNVELEIMLPQKFSGCSSVCCMSRFELITSFAT